MHSSSAGAKPSFQWCIPSLMGASRCVRRRARADRCQVAPAVRSSGGMALKDPVATALGGSPDGRFDAFVSYARADLEFVANRLQPEVEGRGKRLWLDLEDIPPASVWRARIEAGIAASRALLFVLTPESAGSRECRE